MSVLTREPGVDLEHVKALILDHFPVIFEQIHAKLQVVSFIDICCHHSVVGTVKKNLPQKFDRLAFGKIRIRHDQLVVILVEEHSEVDTEIMGHHCFMASYDLLFCSLAAQESGLGSSSTHTESCECVSADLEGASIDPGEELPENASACRFLTILNLINTEGFFVALVVENNHSHVLVFESFAKDYTTRHSRLAVLITIAELFDNFRALVDDIFDSGWGWLGTVHGFEPKHIRKYRLGVFTTFERK